MNVTQRSKRPTQRYRAAATVVATTAMLLSGGLPAHAADAQDKANRIAAYVERAASHRAIAVPDQGLVASVRSARVQLPAAGTGTVTVASAQGSVPPLSIDLPNVSSATAVVADDGTAIYDGAEADLAVQALSDGTIRAQTVLTQRSAPSEYAYTFDGVTPVVKPDGSVELTVPGEEVTVVVGTIAAPWAKDAAGVDVPTRYRVEGSTLVQVIDHTTGPYAYPVVADPWITLGWRFYVNYSKSEVKRVAPYAWTSRFAALACLTIPNAVIAGACAIAVDQQASGLRSTYQYAARNNRCVQLTFLYPPATLLTGYRSFACSFA